MEEQKGKIITYLESEEAKARIAKYIDTYALGLSTEKISIQHAIKRAIENVKSLKYQVGRIGDNASIGIIFGNFDIKKNLITINDSYLNEE